MPNLAELLAKAKANREDAIAIYSKPIQEAVAQVMNSQIGQLTAVNHIGEEPAEVAFRMTDKVASAVTDPAVEFRAICTNRGMSSSDVEVAVLKMSEVLGLKPGAVECDEELIIAVATYIKTRPHLYDDLVFFADL